MIQDHSFFLKGNHIGILLIHGLTGTPNEVRGIARQFNQAGYSVYGVQLAGHCGDIDDLIKTNWQDWYASVCTAARALRQETTQIFVAGLSMGALLALKYASEHHVNGVISYSPTFKYNGWSVPTWSKLIGPVGLPIVSKINRFKHTTFDEAEPYGIKNKSLRDRIVNAMNSDDSSVAGLPGNPWYSLYELQKLSRDVRKHLRQITAPCLCLHAFDDDIAHRKNSEMIYSHIRGPKRLIWLYNSYHMITIDNDRKQVINESLQFIEDFSSITKVSA
ncbi:MULTISPECIES: alpha/beta hydrolase [unclassified Acinetobacter]|uniref:alpha/beta hydrolase n=1 Tax=unclassified Acinetobacter TaxID=196816 RepID=UPI0029345603|nr:MULTISPECIES: alpha/beta fold hydrolase [unclassified Acinetobacter]WOE31853.1 alpha/beta fold hydrolase [Acinetobacter sp. SAAs470]WOE37320.1 alpha/beta fold hydrolase [Acinetobacter sp. SAAs474]